MKYIVFLSILTGFFLLSCEDEKSNSDMFDENTISKNHFCHGSAADRRTIIGEGPRETLNLSLQSFSHVYIAGAMESKIQSQVSNQSVKLRAQQNILDVIDVDVIGDTLMIDFEDNICIETDSAIALSLSMANDLKSFTIVGAGDLEASGPKQNNLAFVIVGAGNVNTLNLPADTCNILVSGTGAFQLEVNELINITGAGTASVQYKGDPVINKTVAGIASIEKLD